MRILGLDIGGTRIKAGLIEETGQVTARAAVASPLDCAGFGAALRELREALGGAVPDGVGVGCKGIIDYRTTRIVSLPGTLHYLEGLLLSELVRECFGQTRVEADNDARVAMAGEMVWGAARGRLNACLLTLGTGVGGAVVADGRLLRGVGGVAGHFGHLVIDPDGPLCICGNHGCLETLFSAHSIESQAAAMVHRGCDSLLTRRFLGRAEAIVCKDVFDAAAEGDGAARLIIDRGVRALGVAVADLLHCFDPEVVILGGQISQAGAWLFEAVQKEAAWRTRVLVGRHVPVIPQQVDDPSGVAGAAALLLAAP